MRIMPSRELLVTGINASEYTVEIPGAAVNIQTPTVISNNITIDGSASISVWAGSIAGQQRSITARVSPLKAQILKNIHRLPALQWLVSVDNRRFLAYISIDSLVPAQDSKGRFEASISMVFVREVQ